MEEMNRDMKLFIPQGLKPRKEAIRGFYADTFLHLMIAWGGDVVFTLLIYFVFKSRVVASFFLFIVAFTSYAMLKKDDLTNVSPIDLITDSINYFKSQKIYHWKPMSHYELIKIKIEKGEL